MMVTVIGRGHSGTRAMSHTLTASGVYMGATRNNSGDLIPAESFYEACRVLARHVRHRGGLQYPFFHADMERHGYERSGRVEEAKPAGRDG